MNEKTSTLADVLRGTRAGRVQSVGLVQVIPLLADFHDNRFAPINDVKVRTSNYGTLVFRNPDPKRPIMVPRDAGFITKKHAQDHAIPVVKIVMPAAELTVDMAACIQDSQGGLIAEGDHRLIILPLQIREKAFLQRKTDSYDKLWPVIRETSTSMGVSGETGQVIHFLVSFSKQLDEFIAEFEPVPDQVGAIVLVSGHVVGIERTPSADYWLEVWETLIRDCYGSWALYQAQQDKTPPETRVSLAADVKDLDALAGELTKAEKREAERVAEVVRALSAEPLVLVESEASSGLTIDALESEQFVGNVVRDNGQVIYTSMTAREGRLNADPSAVEAFVI